MAHRDGTGGTPAGEDRPAGRMALALVACLAVGAASGAADDTGTGPVAVPGPSDGASGGVSAPGADLDVALSPVADGRVRFTVTNRGDVPVALLVRDTPLDAFPSRDLFEVIAPARDWPGVRRLPWIGPLAKRLPPGADEVRVLAPGASASSVVAVAELYAVPADGSYTVRWAGTLRVAPGTGEIAAAAGDASPIAPSTRSRAGDALAGRAPADVVGIDAGGAFVETAPAAAAVELSLAAAPVPSTPRIRPARHEGCSIDERALIEEAATIAEAWTAESRAGLQALDPDERPDSPRYRLWFGRHEPTRFDTVVDAFRGMEDAFADETLSYECGCTEPGVFAYVNPYIAYDITLCPVFWATTADGRDSRAGTLIHELSHFLTVAGTVDHAYAQVPSQRLAASRPDLAIENADSYGYFAENQPAVAIEPRDGPPADDDPPAGPGPTFATLGPEDTVEGNVRRGQRRYYRVDGADSVTLESLSGDADLSVFADAALRELTCRSELVAPVDACALDPQGASWVEVLGYAASRYRLSVGPAVRAQDGGGNGEAIPLLGTLDVGDAVTGEVARSAIVAWRLADGGVVELRSDTGDADLYVHSVPAGGGPLGDATLVCRSFGDSAQGDVTERCRVAPGAPHYLLVAGFEAAAYTLSIGAADQASTRPGDESIASGGSVSGVAIAASGGGPADDGSIASGGSAGSGGGAAGGPWWLLLGPLALRVGRRGRARDAVAVAAGPSAGQSRAIVTA